MKKALVIMGSARSDGNTRKLVHELDPHDQIPLIDLNALNISYYDYDHKNQDDDFLPLMERILEQDVLIFASPVYWYNVSAQLKTFFDRLTDCVTIKKEWGKALAGKKVFLLVSYSNPILDHFEIPIKLTCEYFNMEYKGAFFHYSGTKEELKKGNHLLSNFREKVSEELSVSL